LPTKVIPQSIKNIFRKIPIIKQLAYELEIVFYKYSENNSEKYDSLSNKKFLFFEKIAQNKLKFNLNKNFFYSLSIFGFVFFLGFLLFFISQSKTNNSKITIKPIVLEKGF